MNTELIPSCPLNIPAEALSALRDNLLSATEAERLRAHLRTCPACQQQVQGFERIAALLRESRELDPGGEIWQGVQARLTRAPRRWTVRPPGRSFFSTLAAAVTLVLLVALFVRVLGNLANTPRPVATSSSTPAAGFTVTDPTLARHISFAYVTNETLWVSRQGGPPQAVAHLGITGTQLSWALSWTPDQTRLLVAAVDSVSETARAWILTLSGLRLTPLSGTVLAAVVAGGCLFSCAWIADRYLLYAWNVGGSPHYLIYRLYDTQAQRAISTPLDDQPVSQIEVRGSQVYFTPYALSNAPGATATAVINRFDLASGQITKVFTLPGKPIDEQGLAGSWDLSGDARQVVASLCSPYPACHNFYQDTSGRVLSIFPGQYGGATIAPDGTHAAELVVTSSGPNQATNFALVQQAVPLGSAVTSPLPANSTGQEEHVLGWVLQPLGVFITHIPTDSTAPSQVTGLWFAPVGSTAPARLVETMDVAAVAFAPPTL